MKKIEKKAIDRARNKGALDWLSGCLIAEMWNDERKWLGLPPKPVPARYLRVRAISRVPFVFSRRQRTMAKKHGTPAEFSQACYARVPGDISMDEARAAIEKYNREWEEAA